MQSLRPKDAKSIARELKAEYDGLLKNKKGYSAARQQYADKLLENLKSRGLQHEAALLVLQNHTDIAAEFLWRCQFQFDVALLQRTQDTFGALFFQHLMQNLSQAEDSGAYIAAKSYLRDDAIFDWFFSRLSQHPALVRDLGLLHLLCRPARGPGDKKNDWREPIHLGNKIIKKVFIILDGNGIETVTEAQRGFALGIFEFMLSEKRFGYIEIPEIGIHGIHRAAWCRAQILGKNGNWKQAIAGYEEVMYWMEVFTSFENWGLKDGYISGMARAGVARLEQQSRAAGNRYLFSDRYAPGLPTPPPFAQQLREQRAMNYVLVADAKASAKRKRGEGSDKDSLQAAGKKRKGQSVEGGRVTSGLSFSSSPPPSSSFSSSQQLPPIGPALAIHGAFATSPYPPQSAATVWKKLGAPSMASALASDK